MLRNETELEIISQLCPRFVLHNTKSLPGAWCGVQFDSSLSKGTKSLPSIEVQGETSAGSVGEQRPRFSPRTHTGIICHIGSSKALLRRQTIQIF